MVKMAILMQWLSKLINTCPFRETYSYDQIYSAVLSEYTPFCYPHIHVNLNDGIR